MHHWIGAGFVIAGAIVAQFSSDRQHEETPAPPRPRATTQHQTYAPATMHLQQPHVVSPTVSVVAPPSVPQRAQGRDIETGMIIMVCAMLILPAIDTFAKLLAHTVQAGQVSWSRFAFQTVLLAPLALIKVRSWDPPATPLCGSA